MESTQKKCQSCGCQDRELLKCTRCKQTFYCGSQCQKKDWASHKLKCSKPKSSNNSEKEEKIDGMNEFRQLKHIGNGNFSTIFRGISKKDQKIYAIKQAEKAKLQRMRKQADLFMEKHCLSKLIQCPYVVRLHKTFQDEINLYIQMDCPSKGQLWDYAKNFGIPSQSVFKYFICHILKAISSIHDQYEIVHRDIKPQNILLTENYEVRFIDFGTAKDLERPDIKGSGNGLKGRKPFQHYVGTPNYMAPQCIHNKASEKISDIYSLSGLFYFLKVGSAPFAGGSEYLIFKKTLQTEIFLPSEIFSQDLKDLIEKMNNKDMQKRLTLKEVFSHPYFKDVDFDNLPTYEQSLKNQTSFEIQLGQQCKQLQSKYGNIHKQQATKKLQIYKQEILPYLDKIVQTSVNKEEWEKRILITKFQIEYALNLRDDFNFGFTEIYKEFFNIKQPKSAELIDEITDKIDNLSLSQECMAQ